MIADRAPAKPNNSPVLNEENRRAREIIKEARSALDGIKACAVQLTDIATRQTVAVANLLHAGEDALRHPAADAPLARATAENLAMARLGIDLRDLPVETASPPCAIDPSALRAALEKAFAEGAAHARRGLAAALRSVATTSVPRQAAAAPRQRTP